MMESAKILKLFLVTLLLVEGISGVAIRIKKPFSKSNSKKKTAMKATQKHHPNTRIGDIGGLPPAVIIEGLEVLTAKLHQGSCAENQFFCFNKLNESMIGLLANLEDLESFVELDMDISQCVPEQWVCDGEDDCQNGADEVDCYDTPCNENLQFDCYPAVVEGELPPNKVRCIPTSWQCDGEHDCEDGIDEFQNCEDTPCVEDDFICASENGSSKHQCIERGWVCDGEKDCPLADDEVDCVFPSTEADEPIRCLRAFHSVVNASHLHWVDIPSSWRCDGVEDCADGLDELNCTEVTTTSLPPSNNLAHGLSHGLPPCPLGQFRCPSDQRCIPSKLVCDNRIDCQRGEDEQSCNKEPCPDGFHKCQLTGVCLNEEWRCDGTQDCAGGSDEESCEGELTQCPPGFVSFGGYRCLHLHIFPRRWLRAAQWCRDLGSNLAYFDQDSHTQLRFRNLLTDQSVIGWNYWVGHRVLGSGPNSIVRPIFEKEMEIPFWLINGKQCESAASPVQTGHCFYLHHADLNTYQSKNCNDHAGFICETIRAKPKLFDNWF